MIHPKGATSVPTESLHPERHAQQQQGFLRALHRGHEPTPRASGHPPVSAVATQLQCLLTSPFELLLLDVSLFQRLRGLWM